MRIQRSKIDWANSPSYNTTRPLLSSTRYRSVWIILELLNNCTGFGLEILIVWFSSEYYIDYLGAYVFWCPHFLPLLDGGGFIRVCASSLILHPYRARIVRLTSHLFFKILHYTTIRTYKRIADMILSSALYLTDLYLLDIMATLDIFWSLQHVFWLSQECLWAASIGK